MRIEARLRRLERAALVSDRWTLARRDALALRAALSAPAHETAAALKAIGPSPLRDYLLFGDGKG